MAEPPRRLDRARAEWRTRHYGRLPDEAYHGTSERFQKLLRYADVKTTMIYTHVLGLGA